MIWVRREAISFVMAQYAFFFSLNSNILNFTPGMHETTKGN